MIPVGAELTVGQRLSLRHTGDVVLEQTLGRPVASIVCDGTLTLSTPLSAETLTAAGTIRAARPLEAEFVYGSEVHLEAGGQFGVVAARDRVVLGPGEFQIAALVAPTVEVDEAASGRIGLLCALHATPVPGLAAIPGDPTDILRARGLVLLEGRPMPRPVAPADLQLNQLGLALSWVEAGYEGASVPAGVQELQRLVASGDCDTLKGRIVAVWNEILDVHQTHGYRPPHQVSHAFRVMADLVGEG